MQNWKALLLGCASAAVIAGGAHAREGNYYVGGYVGTNLLQEQDIDFDGEETGVALEGVEFNAESAGTGSLVYGYDYNSPWRGELELAYRVNNLGQANDGPDTISSGGGEIALNGSDADIHSVALMANVIRDFDVTENIGVYAGAGLGVTQLSLSAEVDTGTDAARTFTDVDDEDVVLAGQLILGAGYQVTESWTLETRYTYFVADEGDFDGAELDGLYQAHALTVGGRYTFGQKGQAPEPRPEPVAVVDPADVPPAPPAVSDADLVAPAPVVTTATPCADTNFVVYFEWDRSHLTQQARGIIAEAVDRARACGLGNVNVVGHTDTSGAEGYNVGLSNRRSRTVVNELRSLGVPGGQIASSGRGETDPAIPTADGVREPLNRRAEVTISLF